MQDQGPSVKWRFTQAPRPRFRPIPYDCPPIRRLYELHGDAGSQLALPLHRIAHFVETARDAAAKRFGYTSLLGLRGRERSLREAASHTIDEDERTRRTALADDVKSEIEQAFARGQVVVVRRRATNAVTDGVAWFLYAIVIAGLVFFAIGTDKVSSAREDPIATAKACGEARNARRHLASSVASNPAAIAVTAR